MNELVEISNIQISFEKVADITLRNIKGFVDNQVESYKNLHIDSLNYKEFIPVITSINRDFKRYDDARKKWKKTVSVDIIELEKQINSTIKPLVDIAVELRDKIAVAKLESVQKIIDASGVGDIEIVQKWLDYKTSDLYIRKAIQAIKKEREDRISQALEIERARSEKIATINSLIEQALENNEFLSSTDFRYILGSDATILNIMDEIKRTVEDKKQAFLVAQDKERIDAENKARMDAELQHRKDLAEETLDMPLSGITVETIQDINVLFDMPLSGITVETIQDINVPLSTIPYLQMEAVVKIIENVEEFSDRTTLKVTIKNITIAELSFILSGYDFSIE